MSAQIGASGVAISRLRGQRDGPIGLRQCRLKSAGIAGLIGDPEVGVRKPCEGWGKAGVQFDGIAISGGRSPVTVQRMQPVKLPPEQILGIGFNVSGAVCNGNMLTGQQADPTALRGLIAGTAFVALSLGVATVSTAAGSQDERQITVKYADLDVSTTQGANLLYGRIHAAAEGVCEHFVDSDYFSAMRRQACVSKAIDGAVNQVAKPALSAVYNAHKGTPQPVIVVASGTR